MEKADFSEQRNRWYNIYSEHRRKEEYTFEISGTLVRAVGAKFPGAPTSLNPQTPEESLLALHFLENLDMWSITGQ